MMLTIFGLAAAGIILSIYYKDEIVQFFVDETNKYIATPIEVEKIDLSLFTQFPNVSIDLHKVTIKDSYKDQRGILGPIF